MSYPLTPLCAEHLCLLTNFVDLMSFVQKSQNDSEKSFSRDYLPDSALDSWIVNFFEIWEWPCHDCISICHVPKSETKNDLKPFLT